ASRLSELLSSYCFFPAEDGIRDDLVTGVQTCALPIYLPESVGGRGAFPKCDASTNTLGQIRPLPTFQWHYVAKRSGNELGRGCKIGRASCREREKRGREAAHVERAETEQTAKGREG